MTRHGAAPSLRALRRWRLVGRERELAAAWEALGRVRADGRARALHLRGEPGVGRTRLLDALGDRAHEEGAAWAVRRTAERSDPLPDPGAVTTADRPTLLLLDDLEHDPEARALATRVLAARDAEAVPALVVLATDAGPASAPPETADLLQRLVAPGEALTLGPLERDDAEALARQVARVDDRTLVAALAAAEGDPGALIGRLTGVTTGLRPGPDPRLTALAEDEGEEAVQALELLAVAWGPRTGVAWASACAARGLPSPARWLERAGIDGLTRREGEGLSPGSPALRAALLRPAEQAGRAPGHHAAWVEVSDGTRTGELFALGRHLHLAGRSEEAVEPLLRSALVQHPDGLEAVRLAAEALDAIGEPTPSLRRARRDYLEAVTWYTRGAHGPVRALLRRAAAAAGGDPALALRIEAQVAADALVDGRIHAPLEAAELPDDAPAAARFYWVRSMGFGRRRGRAREVLDCWLDAAENDALWASERASIALLDGDLTQARRWLDRAAAAEGPEDWGALDLELRSTLTLEEGRPEEAARIAGEAEAGFRRTGNLHGLRGALLRRAEAAAALGDPATALEGLEVCRAMDRALAVSPAETGLARARVLVGAGRREEAREALAALSACAAPDARADLRGQWLALAVAAAGDADASRAAREAWEAELAAGGVRLPGLARLVSSPGSGW